MAKILGFLSSELGVTPHPARSTGSPRGGDCGDLCPPLQHAGRERRTQRPLHAACPSPAPSEVGEGREQGRTSAPAKTLQVRGPQSRKLVSSWGPAQEELRAPTVLVPVSALPTTGWVTRAPE